MADRVEMVKMRLHAKFNGDRSNHCWDMAIFLFFFQDGGRRHPRFLKGRNFNGRWGEEGHCASSCQILRQSVKPLLRYGDFSIFPKKRPSAFLDLWGACLGHPRRAFGGLYHFAKFGLNRYSSFDNTQVLIFCELGLKTPTFSQKVFGGFYPLNVDGVLLYFVDYLATM